MNRFSLLDLFWIDRLALLDETRGVDATPRSRAATIERMQELARRTSGSSIGSKSRQPFGSPSPSVHRTRAM